jgi:hypothetical protein
MVPGSILGVQPDNITQDAFLGNNSPTIDVASAVPNTANTYVNNGLKTVGPSSFGSQRPRKQSFGSKRSFGSGPMVYTPELVTSGTGTQVLYQGEPPYMADKRNIVSEDNNTFVSPGSGFGAKKNKPVLRSRPKLSMGSSKPVLSSKFGGATITLKNGKVFVKS